MKVTATFQLEDRGEPSLETCWFNMQLADRIKALALFAASARAWINLSGLNFQALERELRQRGFDTHLIATPLPQNAANLTICNGQSYYCTYSCRPRELAIKELLQHADSYEQNFARLSQTDDLILSASSVEEGALPPVSPLTQLPMKKLVTGRYRIHFV